MNAPATEVAHTIMLHVKTSWEATGVDAAMGSKGTTHFVKVGFDV